MTNNDEIERKSFEGWIMSLPHSVGDDISRKSNGEYFHLSTHWCWKSWQASRNCIELKLPNTAITAEIGPAVSLEKLMAILACNGIKVKT